VARQGDSTLLRLVPFISEPGPGRESSQEARHTQPEGPQAPYFRVDVLLRIGKQPGAWQQPVPGASDHKEFRCFSKIGLSSSYLQSNRLNVVRLILIQDNRTPWVLGRPIIPLNERRFPQSLEDCKPLSPTSDDVFYFTRLESLQRHHQNTEGWTYSVQR